MTTSHAAPPPRAPLPARGMPQRAITTVLPRAGSHDGMAPLHGDNARLVQVGLFVAGAILLPAGIIVICLGWYGIANTPYMYDQLIYIVSGGMLGLGITFVGGFLYFGAWIARVGADLNQADKRLSDTLLILADSISQAASATTAPGASATPHSIHSLLVVAGNSNTVHRADCVLVTERNDLSPAQPGATRIAACRLCRPAE